MILKIFAVRDSATSQFGTPMFLISDGQAVRSFSDEVNRKDAQNQLYTHPDDFELFGLGQYDVASGEFKTVNPVSVVTGKSVKVRE